MLLQVKTKDLTNKDNHQNYHRDIYQECLIKQKKYFMELEN